MFARAIQRSSLVAAALQKRPTTMLPLTQFGFSTQQRCEATQFHFLDEVICEIDESTLVDNDAVEVKGRNSRKPKKANHGARPCSSYMRKLKKKGWYHILRDD